MQGDRGTVIHDSFIILQLIAPLHLSGGLWTGIEPDCLSLVLPSLISYLSILIANKYQSRLRSYFKIGTPKIILISEASSDMRGGQTSRQVKRGRRADRELRLRKPMSSVFSLAKQHFKGRLMNGNGTGTRSTSILYSSLAKQHSS